METEQEVRTSVRSSVSTELGCWRRSENGAVLGGVCAGFAERFALPVWLVRTLAVLSGLAVVGVPVYLALWLVLPRSDGTRILQMATGSGLLLGGLIAFAMLLLLGPEEQQAAVTIAKGSFPFAIVLLGCSLLLGRADRSAGFSDSPMRTRTATPTPPTEEPAVMGPPPGVAFRAPQPLPQPRAPRPRPFLGPIVLCCAGVVAAAAILLRLGGVVSLRPGVIAAILLSVLGFGLVISGWWGRARGLLLVAVPLGAVLAALPLLDIVVWDRIDAEPINMSVAPRDVHRFAGKSLDYSRLRSDSDRSFTIDQTVGNLSIRLPRHMKTQVDVSVGTGSVDLLSHSITAVLDLFSEGNPAADWSKLPVTGALADVESLKGLGLSAADLDVVLPNSWQAVATSGDGIGTRFRRTVGSGESTLHLRIRLGTGRVELLDPRWTGPAPKLIQPVQVCTSIGINNSGMINACGELSSGGEVPVCPAFENRALRTQIVLSCFDPNADRNRPVCWNQLGRYVLCNDVGIDASPDPLAADAGDPNAGDPNAGDPNAGDPNAGDPNAGDPNATNPAVTSPTTTAA